MREATKEQMVAFLVDTRGRSVEEATRIVEGILAARVLSPVKGKPGVFTGNAATRQVASALRGSR